MHMFLEVIVFGEIVFGESCDKNHCHTLLKVNFKLLFYNLTYVRTVNVCIYATPSK